MIPRLLLLTFVAGPSAMVSARHAAFGGLVLPPVVYATEGWESNIYFDNIRWPLHRVGVLDHLLRRRRPAFANASRYHDMGDFTRGRCCRFIGDFVIKNVYIDDRAATTQTPTRGGRAPTAVQLASRVLRSLASGLFPPLRLRGLQCELKVQWRHVLPSLEVLTQRHPLHRHVLGTDCACVEQSNIGCTL